MVGFGKKLSDSLATTTTTATEFPSPDISIRGDEAMLTEKTTNNNITMDRKGTSHGFPFHRELLLLPLHTAMHIGMAGTHTDYWVITNEVVTLPVPHLD